MNYENTAPEVIEIGKAQEMILGEKVPGGLDLQQRFIDAADNDLDD
jgi:hypothetical protein